MLEIEMVKLKQASGLPEDSVQQEETPLEEVKKQSRFSNMKSMLGFGRKKESKQAEAPSQTEQPS